MHSYKKRALSIYIFYLCIILLFSFRLPVFNACLIDIDIILYYNEDVQVI